MNRYNRLTLALVAMALLAAPGFGQDANTSLDPSANTSNSTQYSVSPMSSTLISNPAEVEALRNGLSGDEPSRPMPLAHYQFIYGASTSAIYQSGNTLSSGGTEAGNSVIASPFIGLLGRTRTGSYRLDYTASVGAYNSLGQSQTAFHQLSMSIDGMFSRRWSWGLSASSGYGSQVARETAPLAFRFLANAPAPDASNAVINDLATNLLSSQFSGTLGWLASPQSHISLSLNGAFTSTDGARPSAASAIATQSISTGARLQYERTISSTLSWRGYGQMEHTLGGLPCSSFGGGAGLSYTPNRRLTLSGEAGPEHSGPNCGGQQSVNFNANAGFKLDQRTSIAANVSRVFTTLYRLNSRWEDDMSGEISRQFESFEVGVDGGFVHGQPLAIGLPAYRGYFFTPRISRKLTRTLAMTFEYRRFYGSALSSASGNASYAMFSLQWSPKPIAFPR